MKIHCKVQGHVIMVNGFEKAVKSKMENFIFFSSEKTNKKTKKQDFTVEMLKEADGNSSDVV